MAHRVAVIEDDPAIGSMLQSVLRLEGFEVTLVRDGKSAMHRLRSGRFHAVILDIMLPGQDGITLLHQIRSSLDTDQLPVVMLTAKTDDATTWAGWQAGCDLFLAKPVDPDDVVQAVRRLVALRSGTREVQDT